MSPAELGKKQRNFEDAVLTHSKSLYITAYNLTGDKARAEDLTQETYLKAYNSFASFRLGTNSRAWLSRIMMNTYINDYHKSKREVDWEGFESSIPIPAKENSFNEISFQLNERDLLKEWVDDEIRHAINRLPEKYRKAVIMFDLQGHTYQELAETFNCAIGTIKSRLFRGRTLLKRLLTKYARQKGMIPAGAMTN